MAVIARLDHAAPTLGAPVVEAPPEHLPWRAHPVATVVAVGAGLTGLLMAFTAVDLLSRREVWENAHWTVAPLTGLVAALVGARSTSDPVERRVRALIGAMFGIWTVGQLIWNALSVTGQAPFPSAADIFFLGAVLPVLPLRLLTARTLSSGASRKAIYLDGTSVVLAIVALVIMLEPLPAPALDLANALALAYPITFLSIAGITFVGVLGTRARIEFRGVLLIVLGCLIVGATYGWWIADASFSHGTVGLLPGYVLSGGLIVAGVGAATWKVEREVRPARLRGAQIASAVVPLAASAIAVATLLVPNVPSPQEIVLKACAVGATFLLVTRQTILLRERGTILMDLRASHTLTEMALADNQHLAAELQASIDEIRHVQGQLIHASKQTAVADLAAAVAHEVNNPLTGVLGYADLLLHDLPAEAAGRPELETIRDEALRARKIVRSLLEFARPRAPERLLTDVNELIRGTIDLVRYHLERGGITIEEVYGDIPEVQIDPADIGQAVLNLVNNAATSMSSGGTLRVATRATRSRIVITIADDGVGMDRDTLRNAFEPFFTTRELDAGHGLGLPVSLGIVEAHAGMLTIKSKPGHGAVAEVSLPTAAPSTPISTHALRGATPLAVSPKSANMATR